MYKCFDLTGGAGVLFTIHTIWIIRRHCTSGFDGTDETKILRTIFPKNDFAIFKYDDIADDMILYSIFRPELQPEDSKTQIL